MEYDADLFEPEGDALIARVRPMSARSDHESTACSAAMSRCVVADSGSRDFFQGACIPQNDSEQRGQFLDACLLAQDNERLRLGRELHDSTGQLLLALRLGIAHLKVTIGTGGETESIEEIEDVARQIDREIRAFSYIHYPAELNEGGLLTALQMLVRGFTQRTGLKVSFRSICDHALANGAAAVALLRVAQEALMNVHRHARASSARVTLTEHKNMVELSVQDDGQGMPRSDDGSTANGVGLQGMRHRVERLGGHFAIRRLKHGTKVVASLAVGRGR